jgi:hypothetical protein
MLQDETVNFCRFREIQVVDWHPLLSLLLALTTGALGVKLFVIHLLLIILLVWGWLRWVLTHLSHRVHLSHEREGAMGTHLRRHLLLKLLLLLVLMRVLMVRRRGHLLVS